MTKYVVSIQFPNDDTTYRAFSDLQSSEAGSSVLTSAILEKDDQGNVTVPQGSDPAGGGGFVGGSLIGMLVGILGGPLGVLLGWGVGATIGAATDADRADDQLSAIDMLGRNLQPGRNVLLLETDEDDTAVLDAWAARDGGTVARETLDEVEVELQAERNAIAAAQKAAREQLKQQRRAEREAKREARHDS